MLSRSLLLGLAASTLTTANEAIVYREIKVRQLSFTSTAAATAAMTTSYAGFTDACLPPNSILSPPVTGSIPLPPDDIMSYILTASITDICAIPTVPASLSAQFASYTKEVLSWESVNGPAVSSWESAIVSWEASVPASCGFTIATSGLGVCSSGTAVKSSAATGTGTSKGAGSTGAAPTGSGSVAGSSTATGSAAAKASSSGASSLAVGQVWTVLCGITAASFTVIALLL